MLMENKEIPVTLVFLIFLNLEFSILQTAKENQKNWNELINGFF